MNCPAMPPGGGRGMKFRKPFRPKTRKITPARYRAIAETVLIISMASIIFMSISLMMYTFRRFRFYGKRQEAEAVIGRRARRLNKGHRQWPPSRGIAIAYCTTAGIAMLFRNHTTSSKADGPKKREKSRHLEDFLAVSDF